jgi:hypothetical protein
VYGASNWTRLWVDQEIELDVDWHRGNGRTESACYFQKNRLATLPICNEATSTAMKSSKWYWLIDLFLLVSALAVVGTA